MKKTSLLLVAILLSGLTLQAVEIQPAAPADLTKARHAKNKRIPAERLEPYVPLEIGGDKVVQDNINRLMWEVKNAKDGTKNYANPNDADNTYNWYNPDPATNGTVYDQPHNSSDFLDAMNARHYAGYSDWRLPTHAELKTLLVDSDNNTYIDTTLFPNTVCLTSQGLQYYWTSTEYEYSNTPHNCIWVVSFRTGHSEGNHSKANIHHIRAVRSLN